MAGTATKNLSPSKRACAILLRMNREDIIRFYQATPIWLWPLLWLRLHWLRAYMDRCMASGTGGLARIFTDGRGGLRIEWIVHEEKLSPNRLLKKSGVAHGFCF